MNIPKDTTKMKSTQSISKVHTLSSIGEGEKTYFCAYWRKAFFFFLNVFCIFISIEFLRRFSFVLYFRAVFITFYCKRVCINHSGA